LLIETAEAEAYAITLHKFALAEATTTEIEIQGEALELIKENLFPDVANP